MVFRASKACPAAVYVGLLNRNRGRSLTFQMDECCLSPGWLEVYMPGYVWIPVDPFSGDQGLPANQAHYFGHFIQAFSDYNSEWWRLKIYGMDLQ